MDCCWGAWLGICCPPWWLEIPCCWPRLHLPQSSEFWNNVAISRAWLWIRLVIWGCWWNIHVSLNFYPKWTFSIFYWSFFWRWLLSYKIYMLFLVALESGYLYLEHMLFWGKIRFVQLCDIIVLIIYYDIWMSIFDFKGIPSLPSTRACPFWIKSICHSIWHIN